MRKNERVCIMEAKKKMFMLICSGVLLGSTVSMATEAVGSDAIVKEYSQDLSRVGELGQKAELEGLDRLASELEEKWFGKNREKYGYIMLGICGTFGSLDFGTDRQYDLARKYAVLVLEKSRKLEEENQIPIEVEFILSGHVQNMLNLKEAVKGEDWPNKRSGLAKLYFHAWHRLERKIDTNWDPNDPNIGTPPCPPAGYKGPGGSWMSPEHIKDPTLRAEYETAIEEYRHKHKRHSEQRHLRQLKKSHLPYLQKDILRLYSGPLFDSKTLEEEVLQRDIERYIEDKDVMITLVRGIKNRLLKMNLPAKPQDKQGGRQRGPDTQPTAPMHK